MPRQIHPIDPDDLRQRYLSGETPEALATRYGVHRKTILNRLDAMGVKRRGHSAALLNSYAGTTLEQRRIRLAGTHAATRGRAVSMEKRLRDALGRQLAGNGASELENVVCAELRSRGFQLGQQTAIGPYNCDLTCGSVAVEVFGGGWHWSGGHAARHRQRSRYLLDRGWHLLIFQVDRKRPLLSGGYDKLVAFLEFSQGNPAARRQYWVVGGTGQLITGIRPDLDPLADVWPFESRRWPGA